MCFVWLTCVYSFFIETVNVPLGVYRLVSAPSPFPERDVNSKYDFALILLTSPDDTQLRVEIFALSLTGNESEIFIGPGLDPVQSHYDWSWSGLYFQDSPDEYTQVWLPGNEGNILIALGKGDSVTFNMRFSSYGECIL